MIILDVSNMDFKKNFELIKLMRILCECVELFDEVIYLMDVWCKMIWVLVWFEFCLFDWYCGIFGSEIV